MKKKKIKVIKFKKKQLNYLYLNYFGNSNSNFTEYFTIIMITKFTIFKESIINLNQISIYSK